MSDILSLQEASIGAQCKTLRLPTIGSHFLKIAEQATREGHSHIRYLDALLTAELEEREDRLITRRLFEARIPRMRTLDDFDFKVSPVSMPQSPDHAEGFYLVSIARSKPNAVQAVCFERISTRMRERRSIGKRARGVRKQVSLGVNHQVPLQDP